MIIGAHSIVYTADAAADRAFFKDVLGFSNVDVGGGWLIFGLPPSEVAFHPAEERRGHELYLMTDDIQAFISEMHERGLVCTPPEDEGWGVLTELTLPSGGTLGVYEPRHERPQTAAASANASAAKKKVAKKAPGATQRASTSKKKSPSPVKVGKAPKAKAVAQSATKKAPAKKAPAKNPPTKKAPAKTSKRK